MRPRRGLAALVLFLAIAQPGVPAGVAHAQGNTTHEVRRGDTLFGIARKAKYDNVSRNQMFLAIWRANRDAFPGGNINRLEVGTVLVIPPQQTVAAIPTGEADRLVMEMLARPATGPETHVAATRPGDSTVAPGSPMEPAGGREAAARRYREGLVMERNGDHPGALRAFLEAGEAGDGLAQRKLGQIYDKGNSAVRRDYQTSLRWYQKAREQGVEIDKPLPRMTTR